MKKIIYIIIPALFLVIGAGKAVQNINKSTNKQSEQVLNNLKSGLEESKKTSAKKTNSQEENSSAAQEITLGQEIVLQGDKDSVVETKIFKFNLPKTKWQLLYDQETFATTHDKKVDWNWTELSSKYFYKVSVKLDSDQNILLITMTPTRTNTLNHTVTAKTEEEQADLHVTYASFKLVKDKNSIFVNGISFGMVNRDFKRPILYIE